jgi:DNA invertase Pin-like site-specific DNA recombinase
LAIVYIRQSTPQQVLDHRESTALQYALVDRAVAWGWPRERVLVIDEDQGHSGASAADRCGFQRVLAEVGLDHAGLILGVEMSRLARSNKDWHQLLELCALFQSLLADHDGLYDPADYNDRLLLGLKGAMGEAELHLLRSRLLAGRQHKAERGELFNHLPIGYMFLPSREPGLDEDEQARAVVRLVFDKFDELGTVGAVGRYLAAHDLRLGVRPHSGPNRGRLEWRPARSKTLTSMLRHPIYAGVYTHGRHPIDPRRQVPGRRSTGRTTPPPERWQVVLPGRLPAYITWERYLANQERLRRNQCRPTTPGAPRQGAALLGGLLCCGRCGARLRVGYGGRSAQARYTCKKLSDDYVYRSCQHVAAPPLDAFVSGLALEVLAPAALELSLAAAANLERERGRLDDQWRQRQERARYEAERARRQYDAVEPENRLVARELERRWNEALLAQRQAAEAYDRFRQTQAVPPTPAEQAQLRVLAGVIPALWQAPSTSAAERQTILRHLLEKVVVSVREGSEYVDVTVHWVGGCVSQHAMVRSVHGYEQLADYERLLARVAELRVAGKTTKAIATHLNEEGFRTPRRGARYTSMAVRRLLSRQGLSTAQRPASRRRRKPPANGEWRLGELATALAVSKRTLRRWLARGWVHGWQLAGVLGRWRVWADTEELDRLYRLCAHLRDKSAGPPPAALTTLKPRA